MNYVSNVITIHNTNTEINEILKKCKGYNPKYTMHFSQNEEFFLKIEKEITIPSIKIHNDINNTKPDAKYIDTIIKIITDIAPFIAPVIEETEYSFDPAEPLRPMFYKLYNYNGNYYLYVAKLDLMLKPHNCEITAAGSNDFTHTYKTNNIFIDTGLLPIKKFATENNSVYYEIKEFISETWIDETGKGYFIQGIWMDNELTKFFSYLFINNKIHSYPYYPFICKYKTITYAPLEFSAESRLKHTETLEKVYNFLFPFIHDIEKEFKNSIFSKDMELYKKLKQKTEKECYNDFSSLKIKRYLNSKDMREYELSI
jgi:hypothetical protein